MERVSIIEGKNPIVFIAPHCLTETNTDIITEIAASSSNSYAVINRGWRRSKNYDYYKELADCNNINHCLEDVVKDEFLEPIIRFKNRIRKKHTMAYMFVVHGLGNNPGPKNLSLIVGHGNSNSHTCQKWMVDFFCWQCDQKLWNAYIDPSGPYAASCVQNLCQYFRHWDFDSHINTMQLEIILEMRRNKKIAEITGEVIADIATDLILYNHWDAPRLWKIKMLHST